jgi:hypothetical protein
VSVEVAEGDDPQAAVSEKSKAAVVAERLGRAESNCRRIMGTLFQRARESRQLHCQR